MYGGCLLCPLYPLLFPIYCVSFIALSVGRRLINMCHKRDSLDKSVHVSLKILDRGIQVVAALTRSSEGEDTQMHKDVGGEILAGAAAPGECAICRISYFFLFVTWSYL